MRGNMIVALVAVVLTANTVPAADPVTGTADRERRVRVALALAAADPTCGRCREDVDAARADALSEHKPLVLFVGGCPGPELAKAAERAGAIPAKAAEYKSDNHPAKELRAVVLSPAPDGKGFLIAGTLVDAKAKDVAEAVKRATPVKASKKLSWDF